MTAEALDGVDLAAVTQKVHRARRARRFGTHLRGARVICLDIADDYTFIDLALVALPEPRTAPHLHRLGAARP